MSKIGVALALCVILLGAALLVGDGVGTRVIERGGDIGNSLSSGSLRVDAGNGNINFTTP